MTVMKERYIEAIQTIQSRNARIAQLEAAQRWIPVSERLPDKDSAEVWETYNCVIDRYGEIKSCSLYFMGGLWYSDYGSHADYTNFVISWKELPEPLNTP